MKTPEKRFFEKIKKTKNCWNWIGVKNIKGYGYFKIDGKKVKAHRFSFKLFNGFIPDGKIIMHICDNRKCVCPNHLRVGTVKENNIDMAKKGRVRNRHTGKL